MNLEPKLKNRGSLYKVVLTTETTIDIVLEIGYEISYPRDYSFSHKHEGVIKNKIGRIILDKAINENDFQAFKNLAIDSWKCSAFKTIYAFDNLLTKKFKFKTQVITLSTDEQGSFYRDTDGHRKYID